MKYLIPLLILTTSLCRAEVFPEIYSPIPYWCQYGSWQEGSIGIGSSSGLSYDYLKIDAPSYVLIGSQFRIKADGKYLVNKGDTIYFYDSTEGYLGKKDANTEGNAYFTYTPQTPAHRSGKIWVMKNLHNVMDYVTAQQHYKNNSWPVPYFPPCSQKDVFFQNKPHIGPSGYNPSDITGKSMNVQLPYGFPLYYEVDWNSKAINENVPSKITLYARYERSSRRDIVGTSTVSSQRGTLTLRASGYSIDYGTVKFYAEINDGNYSSDEIHVGNYTYTPSMPSACSQVCPSSLGQHRAQCQGRSSACNYRSW